ncbi:MAG: dihydrodipicolinate synthase family protein [Planctomycetia bacterium]|nr:dihydrodipicolinate synthase family protein [Planctomycetia bacterium]
MNSIPPTRGVAGVLPVFQTPYHDDESIDFDTLKGEIDWLFDRGADGIVMAMVSETLRLTSDERRSLAEHACRFAAGRGPVVISVGAESSRAAELYTRHAETSGAAAVMAIPPVSVAIGEDELLRYYERIVRATGLPVIVQDAGGYVGRPISIEAQARMHAELGDRVMFKPEAAPIGPRLSALRDATGGKARIFEGSGGIALGDSFRRGIVGTMPGADLIDVFVALWRALVAGDERRAGAIAMPLAALVSLESGLDGFLAIEKHLLVRQGIFRNTLVRGPVAFILDGETRAEVDRLFEVLMAAV